MNNNMWSHQHSKAELQDQWAISQWIFKPDQKPTKSWTCVQVTRPVTLQSKWIESTTVQQWIWEICAGEEFSDHFQFSFNHLKYLNIKKSNSEINLQFMQFL
jgi:hypothetical protein